MVCPQGGKDRVAPYLAALSPHPPQLPALGWGPPSGQVLGSHWPCCWLLLLSARLSLNKQGCIATTAQKEPTAPGVEERGSQETIPLGLSSSGAHPGTGYSHGASLSCGATRESELGPVAQ